MLQSIISFITNLPAGQKIGLAVGIVIGIAVLFVIRARQMWTHRGAYGYNVYTADQMRRRLGRWALVAVGAAIIIGGVWTVSAVLGSSDEAGPGEVAAPAITQIPNTKLIIPRLAMEADMIEAPIVAQQWDVSRLTDEVAHLERTAYPGEPGNAVLAGHVTIPDAGWGPFKDLESLQMGDRIFFEDGEQVYTYEVTDRLFVEPTDVWVAYPTDDSRLTLITCAGWSDETEEYTERIVVIAMLVP